MITRMTQLCRPSPLSTLLTAMIVLAWLLSAFHLDLPLFSSQRSALLLNIGAIDGATLRQGEIWRLVSSQFLHVHFLHMLFNLLSIYVLSNSIEHEVGKLALVLSYFVGGTVGQYFGVFFRPDLVSSGASQALMALCGFVLASSRRLILPRFTVATAIVVTVIQSVLDVAVSTSIKPGHGFGFAAGVAIGLGAIAFLGRWSALKRVTQGVAPVDDVSSRL